MPSVAVHADAFARLVESVARVNGMPRARRAFVPTPVIDKTPSELRAYIEGADPVRGRPFMAEVLEALTRAIDEEDLRGVEFDRSTPRLVDPDTEENLHRLFREHRWTDFFPIVLPTEERVAAMLAGTSRQPDEVVGRMRPTGYRELWEFTVEKVAVNAVMAGAEPAHLPVILALAASGFTARQSSTSSMANMVVVNGPIRQEIAMNSGLGALGPYNHANAAIGRAYGLLSQNLQGGSVPGLTYMGAQGNNFNYTSVTVRRERGGQPLGALPRPARLRARREHGDALLHLGQRLDGGSCATSGRRRSRRSSPVRIRTSARSSSWIRSSRGTCRRGFEAKQKLIDWMHENVRIPAGRYWENFTTRNLMHDIAESGVEPWASYWNAAPDELVPVFEPENDPHRGGRRVVATGSGARSTDGTSTHDSATIRPTRRRVDRRLALVRKRWLRGCHAVESRSMC